jgi:hypothetical protein
LAAPERKIDHDVGIFDCRGLYPVTPQFERSI